MIGISTPGIEHSFASPLVNIVLFSKTAGTETGTQLYDSGSSKTWDTDLLKFYDQINSETKEFVDAHSFVIYTLEQNSVIFTIWFGILVSRDVYCNVLFNNKPQLQYGRFCRANIGLCCVRNSHKTEHMPILPIYYSNCIHRPFLIIFGIWPRKNFIHFWVNPFVPS